MTPSEADKVIKDGRTHTFYNKYYNEMFRGTATRRDRWNIWIVTMVNGEPKEGKFDRGELLDWGLVPDRNTHKPGYFDMETGDHITE